MARHKIAIIVGSLRKDSINRKVARSICAFASDKLDCQIVEIGAHLLEAAHNDLLVLGPLP